MRTKSKRILVVDDEQSIQRALKRNLIAGGYEVQVAGSGAEALAILDQGMPDLILLDLCLPGDISGLQVCERVREESSLPPIIVLSARSEEKMKVQAFDLGADDYLTKPFGNEELQARVRVRLRHAALQKVTVSPKEIEILSSEDGYFYMDIPRRVVKVGDQDVKLTPTEFELLRQLMLHTGRVMTHRNLLRMVWGPEYGEEADYLRVYIRQLRRKVEAEPSRPQYILTEPGIGYVFRPQHKN
jgi:two-component system KDP operon response regulator KdpE